MTSIERMFAQHGICRACESVHWLHCINCGEHKPHGDSQFATLCDDYTACNARVAALRGILARLTGNGGPSMLRREGDNRDTATIPDVFTVRRACGENATVSSEHRATQRLRANSAFRTILW